MKEKLFIMLLCFFFFNLNAEIKDTSIKSKLILDSKNYIGDELISKKEFAKKIDLSCNVAHPYGGIEKEINGERKKCIFSKVTFDYENIVDNMKLNEKIYLTPINGINLFLKKTKEPNYPKNLLDDEVKIYTEMNDKVIDQLIIYSNEYDMDSYSAKSQYYFINNHIYVLSSNILEEGQTLNFWGKYSIENNGKFKLLESIKCHYLFKDGKEMNVCK